MASVLVWLVRMCGLVGWGAGAVACAWLLGVAPTSHPWNGPLVWGGVAAGSTAPRVVALWALRLMDEAGPPGLGGVSLKKGVRQSGVGKTGARRPGFDDCALWVKGRTAVVWLLVAVASGAMFACLMSMPSDGRIEKLRDAGAGVSTARVVGKPLRTRAELDDEDQVQGYASRLVLAVDGGPGHLLVKGAYTYDEPRDGTRVQVLWSPSEPGLGGYVNEAKDLPTLAAGRWKAFPDDESGRAALHAFVLLAVVGGVVMGSVFSLAPDTDSLRERAWSAWAQTVRGLFVVGLYLAWRPILLGQEATVVSYVFAGGGFVLILLVYAGTTAF
ncbi:hypothetical protein [Streptomyces sp. NK08204]|uniref:hypothetical protein n=1 Tax=Streptomyces sp. NK08204 TaxID=2873260 RepID=UPI001CED0196|nr:hypothetical protein [Streptomyces sp. NK08204]